MQWFVIASQEESSFTYVDGVRVKPKRSALLPVGGILQLGRRMGQDGADEEEYEE